ncbi:replication protein A 32 kDa subunit isoform X1 [Macaca thibetana thibetana]|nr:replication protein A 32 kDa subunit isoform X1 [Macaca thibetana thibetana]
MVLTPHTPSHVRATNAVTAIAAGAAPLASLPQQAVPRYALPQTRTFSASLRKIATKMWNSGFESYGSSSYGGAGGYTQSPGGFGSPAPSQAEKKSRARAQHIVPCTISQLLSATLVDEVFRIGNVEISQVTIVGIIRHAEKAPTNIVYKIDDMTAAPMDVRQWVDTDDASSENTVVPPETYVKVAGHLRSFQNKKSLVAFKIMPLEDMNEFTTHILEVINAHMVLSKANSQPSAGRAPISNPGMSEAGNFGGNSFLPANGLTVAQNQVLNLIKACPRPEGLNFQDLKNQLKHMSVSSIKQAVDFLSNEGHIYSTVDDDHFKSTDAE